jgi:RNA polymerase sigma-70 factor (ECF subfamily)
MKRSRLAKANERSESHDAELLTRVAAGDVGALGALYDAYAPGLLRFARRAAGSDDAEDIVQTVFLRVVRIAHTFDARVPSARPWLFAITARVVLERRRSLRRWAAALVSLSAHAVPAAKNLGEARSDLEQGLKALTVAKRTVLVLAEVEGFTSDEIASMLEIPVGTVWTRLHHARRELRRFCEEDS